MKCSRCGEECRDNQAFCLKCGNPLLVVPDMDVVEKEIARDVRNTIDGNDTSVRKNKIDGDTKQVPTDRVKRTDSASNKLSDTMDFLEDEFYVDTMPEHDVEAELSLLDIQEIEEEERQERARKRAVEKDREKERAKELKYEVDGIGFGGKAPKFPQEEEENGKVQEVKAEKKMFKVKAIVFSVIAVIVVVIVLILMAMHGKGNNNSKSFTKAYNEGYDYYAAKNYKSALNSFLTAKKLVDNDNDRIKVNKSLLDTYENLEGTEDDQIRILKELIELDSDNADYYKKLVAIYYDNEMEGEIADLLESIDDVSLKSDLSEYSVTSPKFSEEEGEYDSYISVRLTSSAQDIYYTTDGSDPTTKSTKYTDPIKIDKAGETTIKAFAVNDKGLTSKISKATYKINPSEIAGPVISPSGGSYSSQQEITVEVPEGMKCYYTYGDKEIIPTAGDKEYTEPIKMIRGKNYFMAILVSESGAVSEVSENIYQLSLTSTVSYDEALDTVKRYLTSEKIATQLNDEEYIKTDGMIINFSYNSIACIEGGEYYVINASEKDSNGNVQGIVYYGVETVYGTLETLEKASSNTFKFVKTEEESESEKQSE